jgi:hypothetical protein
MAERAGYGVVKFQLECVECSKEGRSKIYTYRKAYRTHLISKHGYSEARVEDYLDANWPTAPTVAVAPITPAYGPLGPIAHTEETQATATRQQAQAEELQRRQLSDSDSDADDFHSVGTAGTSMSRRVSFDTATPEEPRPDGPRDKPRSEHTRSREEPRPTGSRDVRTLQPQPTGMREQPQLAGLREQPQLAGLRDEPRSDGPRSAPQTAGPREESRDAGGVFGAIRGALGGALESTLRGTAPTTGPSVGVPSATGTSAPDMASTQVQLQIQLMQQMQSFAQLQKDMERERKEQLISFAELQRDLERERKERAQAEKEREAVREQAEQAKKEAALANESGGNRRPNEASDLPAHRPPALTTPKLTIPADKSQRAKVWDTYQVQMRGYVGGRSPRYGLTVLNTAIEIAEATLSERATATDDEIEDVHPNTEDYFAALSDTETEVHRGLVDEIILSMPVIAQVYAQSRATEETRPVCLADALYRVMQELVPEGPNSYDALRDDHCKIHTVALPKLHSWLQDWKHTFDRYLREEVYTESDNFSKQLTLLESLTKDVPWDFKIAIGLWRREHKPSRKRVSIEHMLSFYRLCLSHARGVADASAHVHATECNYCHREGHKERECRKKASDKKRQEQEERKAPAEKERTADARQKLRDSRPDGYKTPCSHGDACEKKKKGECKYSHRKADYEYAKNFQCFRFKAGKCAAGDKCPFRHTDERLITKPPKDSGRGRGAGNDKVGDGPQCFMTVLCASGLWVPLCTAQAYGTNVTDRTLEHDCERITWGIDTMADCHCVGEGGPPLLSVDGTVTVRGSTGQSMRYRGTAEGPWGTIDVVELPGGRNLIAYEKLKRDTGIFIEERTTGPFLVRQHGDPHGVPLIVADGLWLLQGREAIHRLLGKQATANHTTVAATQAEADKRHSHAKAALLKKREEAHARRQQRLQTRKQWVQHLRDTLRGKVPDDSLDKYLHRLCNHKNVPGSEKVCGADACLVCALGQQRREGHSRKGTSEEQDAWHSDVAGPYVPAADLSRYILVIVDTLTEYKRYAPIRSRLSKVIAKELQDFQATMSRSPETLRTDGAKDYLGEVAVWRTHNTVKHDVYHRYSPWENGLCETTVQRALYGSTCGLIDSNAPTETWHLAARHAECVDNLIDGAYEKLYGTDKTKRMLRFVAPYGTLVTVVKEEPERDTNMGKHFGNRSFPAFLYGFHIIDGHPGADVAFYKEGALHTLRTQNARIHHGERYFGDKSPVFRELRFMDPGTADDARTCPAGHVLKQLNSPHTSAPPQCSCCARRVQHGTHSGCQRCGYRICNQCEGDAAPVLYDAPQTSEHAHGEVWVQCKAAHCGKWRAIDAIDIEAALAIQNDIQCADLGLACSHAQQTMSDNAQRVCFTSVSGGDDQIDVFATEAAIEIQNDI